MSRKHKEQAFKVSANRQTNSRKGARYHRVATVHEEEDFYEWHPWWVSVGRFLLSLILLFPCTAVTLMVIRQFTETSIVGTLAGNMSTLSFLIGTGLCFLIHLSKLGRKTFLPVYVLGHEVTHAIFVFFCYGKVSAFNANHEGGYIVANRSNILVSLSPYVFPFWSLVIALLFFLTGLVIDTTPYSAYFFLLLGASWIFNLLWTVIMIPLGQSDLKDNGTFFSLNIIYFSNVLILSLLVEIASPDTMLPTWFFDLLNSHLDLFSLVRKQFPLAP